MRNKPTILLLLLPLFSAPLAAAELMTLFTTPQERQIINSNRYKSDQPKPKPVQTAEIELPIQQLVTEEVTREYIISGITFASDGTPVVWINSVAYQDGDLLEDKSKIKVVTGDEVGVRITAPDGKNYYATSGQSLQVTYLAKVEN